MRAFIIFIFLMMWAQSAGAQTLPTTSQTIFTIEINESGNALWTVEKQTPLSTSSEISEWALIINDTGNFSNKKDITDFRDTLNMSLSSAENYSNRSMTIEKFNVSLDIVKNLPSAYGVIRNSFEWTNFSSINSSKIFIGDVFSEELIGMVFSSNNVLIIKMPAGYDVQNATPNFDKRDGNRLIWDGRLYRSFNKGEPSLVLSRTVASSQESSPDITVLIFAVILVSGGLFIFWLRRRQAQGIENVLIDTTATQSEKSQTENGAVQTEMSGTKTSLTGITENNASLRDNAGSETAPKPLPDLSREILGDEEMIEQYLIKFGGQAYQSEIVKESGLSKSKISIVLAKMKEDGRILKIRKGKENIIRLAPKE